MSSFPLMHMLIVPGTIGGRGRTSMLLCANSGGHGRVGRVRAGSGLRHCQRW